MNGWVVSINMDSVDFPSEDGSKIITGGHGLPERKLWEERGNKILEKWGFEKDQYLNVYYRFHPEIMPIFRVLEDVKEEFPVNTRVLYYRASDFNNFVVSSDFSLWKEKLRKGNVT